MILCNSIILLLSIPAFLVHDSHQSCNQYNLKIDENFDTAKFQGTWYEYGRYEHEGNLKKHRVVNDCIVGQYKLENNKISISFIMKNHETNAVVEISAEVWREKPEHKKGELKIKFLGIGLTTDFWIIGGDYESYTVVWACDGNEENIWLLTREPEISDDVKNKINQVMTVAGFDPSKMRITNNKPSVCAW